MEVIKLEEGNIADTTKRAVEVLRAGGVIMYPTDTLYGLGADALSDEAVAKVYAIKGRDEKKPIHCIVSGMDMTARYAEVNTFARMLAKEFLPGPLTLILKKRGIDSGVARGIDTIGIRIPDDKFCSILTREFDAPITTTSANRAGMEPERGVEKILEQLGESAGIDLVVDAGELPPREPSTVIDLSGTEPVILREGAIEASALWSILRPEY